MAQRVVYRLVDDLDHSEADETVAFALDSVSYEIDLSGANAQQLRDALAPYVGAARKVTAKRRSSGRRREGGTAAANEIRAWAAANGYQVSARGRVPAEVREAYERGATLVR